MTAESGIILGIGIALVLFFLVRRADRKRHREKLEALQRKIARSEEAAQRRRERESSGGDRQP
jgi:hypothetical protein